MWLLAGSAQADDVWRERLAFDDPEWRPLVSVGYRMQLVREPTQEGVKRQLGHGFGFEALFPLLSSGRRESRTRLSIALGFGADYGEARVHSAFDAEDPENRLILRDRSAWFHGAVAAVLRVRLATGWALLSSLAWLPGIRRTHLDAHWSSGEIGFPPIWLETPPERLTGHEVVRSLNRGRLAVAIVRQGIRLGLFFGVARRDDVSSWRRGPELELGTQMGVGW